MAHERWRDETRHNTDLETQIYIAFTKVGCSARSWNEPIERGQNGDQISATSLQRMLDPHPVDVAMDPPADKPCFIMPDRCNLKSLMQRREDRTHGTPGRSDPEMVLAETNVVCQQEPFDECWRHLQ